VVSAGAPVSPAIVEEFSGLLEGDARIHTPYGATEAVPVASIGSPEILGQTRSLTEAGRGVCVGRPLGHTEVQIIRISDDPIETWSDDLLVPDGEVGEIVVKGPLVTKGYFERPRHDALSKIEDGSGFWHRMGDLAWRDDKGRLWFCGRKSHRVITSDGPLFTDQCEAVFNNHPQVNRSALVGVGPPGDQRPVIIVEPVDEKADRDRLRKELMELARSHQLTRNVDAILFHPDFPVDIRHNSKIFREKLAEWAAGRSLDPGPPGGDR
jgi:acyl-CoA synthetase (AMP-forming)/AMP-acid ligase II